MSRSTVVFMGSILFSLESEGQLDRIATTKAEALLANYRPISDTFPYVLPTIESDHFDEIANRIQFLRRLESESSHVVGLCSTPAIRSFLIKNKPTFLTLLLTFSPVVNDHTGILLLSFLSNGQFPFNMSLNHALTNVEEAKKYCLHTDDFSLSDVILQEYFLPIVTYIMSNYQTMDRKLLVPCFCFCELVRINKRYLCRSISLFLLVRELL